MFVATWATDACTLTAAFVESMNLSTIPPSSSNYVHSLPCMLCVSRNVYSTVIIIIMFMAIICCWCMYTGILYSIIIHCLEKVTNYEKMGKMVVVMKFLSWKYSTKLMSYERRDQLELFVLLHSIIIILFVSIHW